MDKDVSRVPNQTETRARILAAWAIGAAALIGAVAGYETGLAAEILPDLVNQPVFDPSVVNR
ncbi:MAG: hypothetical protein ACREGD_03455 [Candidatus Saccharimonadales bacterium]